jgi:putative PIN family toxin of toxin-antitoxin system
MRKENIRIIIDTNVWISLLIGQKLKNIIPLFSSQKLQIIVSDELIDELVDVTSRPKFKKYFNPNQVQEFIELIMAISLKFNPKAKYTNCRDEKDNFLLDLIDASKADFLVTGDKDLLACNPFKTAEILNPSDFEKIISTLKSN